MDNRIKRIADHYGYEAQSRQLIEEMARLTQAVNEEWKNANGFLHVSHGMMVDDIKEKVADTEIMLDQIKYLLKIEKETENWRERRLERILEKIEPEKMVTVIGGIHGIHYNQKYKTYYWQVDCDDEFIPGDLAVVHTENGIERVLVIEVKEVPESEAAKYNTAVAKVVFNDGKQQG